MHYKLFEDRLAVDLLCMYSLQTQALRKIYFALVVLMYRKFCMNATQDLESVFWHPSDW